ncbi:MAG: hypothetical protein CO144_02260 [Candidatus Nealsonbacteria bacterium CG_4_9_14_3_um_filter_35_11]|nr:MAG: hypothetical protein COZ88_00595 [Candidatus Nealsonbacteria bacterium CG_4_8_14_3_um_filter_34_13]PJA84325.1 MAG: hypothetical protein CO144_02260 [Candidatus Nealsonbacteria bacterium CG_4_9_14_3_um_filter_35_11]
MKISNLPQRIGVYILQDKDGNILYVGKAKNIKKRVASHLQKKSDFLTILPIERIKDVDWLETDTEKEALLLEQQLIKKYHPRFNIEWQDDKNYFWVEISKENFPRISLTHQRSHCDSEYLGPFVDGKELKNFLKNLRILFPFRTCKNLPQKPCLYFDLKLCLGVCQYRNKFIQQKYNQFIKGIGQLLKIYLGNSGRVEGYDISNISGTFSCGSMVVFENNKPKKSEYRLFKIKKTKGQNDVKSLEEVLLRRMRHGEWKMPDLIILDGGKGQLKAAKKLNLPVLSLAKTKRAISSGRLYSIFSKKYLNLDKFPENVKNTLLQLRDQAHRFAISFHKKRRVKYLLAKKY